MIKKYKNKAIETSETEDEIKKEENLRSFVFPQFNKTIKAKSLSEAREKLQKELAHKDEN